MFRRPVRVNANSPVRGLILFGPALSPRKVGSALRLRFDSSFAPVLVAGGSRMAPSGEVDHGRIEIVLASGRRIEVDAGVDAAALDRVITVLERR